MHVSLAPRLQPVLNRERWTTPDKFITSLTDKQRIPWREYESRVKAGSVRKDADVFTQSLFPAANDLGQGNVCHTSYLHYLDFCYANHLHVVLRPDDIWFVLLTQLAEVVRQYKDQCASLFTTTPGEKREISIDVTGRPLWDLPLSGFVNILKELVPTDVTTFLPAFSTTTDDVLFAEHTAFMDLVSPYYNYSTYCCGIPGVEVEGTPEDWQHLRNAWSEVSRLLISLSGEVSAFLYRVNKVLEGIVCHRHHPDFWKEILVREPCGSGGEKILKGWFTELYWKYPKQLAKIENFSTCTAIVTWRYLPETDFVMHRGCFSSELLEGCILKPHYNFVVHEKLKAPVEVVETKPPFKTEDVTIGQGGLVKPAKPIEFFAFESIGETIPPDARLLRNANFD